MERGAEGCPVNKSLRQRFGWSIRSRHGGLDLACGLGHNAGPEMLPVPSTSQIRPSALRFVLAVFAVCTGVWGGESALADGVGAASAESPDRPKDGAVPGYFEKEGEARGVAVAEERGIALDIDAVREAQEETLAQQARDGGEAWFAPSPNGIRRRLDAFHDGTFILLDNLVRTLDLSWALPGVDYDAELSSLSLVPMARVGGRGDDGDFDAQLKVRADTALPGLERRLHLVFDNLGRDSLPGTDPMKREDDWRLGVSGGWDVFRQAKFDLDGGLRLRAMRVVGYADAAIKWEQDLAEGVLRISPGVFYYTDSGWGHGAHASWQRWFGSAGRWGVDLSCAEKHTERHAVFDFEQTIKVAYTHSVRKTRGWVFQASLFPQIREDTGDSCIDDALLNVSWKSPVYRRWCYATVTPQVDFAKEDARHPHFSLRFALEILFGGESRRLL